jgi:hypothetical protein
MSNVKDSVLLLKYVNEASSFSVHVRCNVVLRGKLHEMFWRRHNPTDVWFLFEPDSYRF